MITIHEYTREIFGLEAAVRGMRNSFNSWDKSDSGDGCEEGRCEHCSEEMECDIFPCDFVLGPNDKKLMRKLCLGGPSHAKFRRMIHLQVDVTAPLYWWKEYDTYKVGTVANSCSTMHTIADKEFEKEDFSIEYLDGFDFPDLMNPKGAMAVTIKALNRLRELYLETKDKKYWYQMIMLLPSSYNQKRTIDLNYEVLHTIYEQRKNHKLDEWRVFCRWIETLPYSADFITPKIDN